MDIVNSSAERALSDYWSQHYTLQHDGVYFCVLCGNTGMVVVENVTGPKGQKLGRTETYCFCPNGRRLREVREH